MLKNIIDNFLDLVYPTKCTLCNEVLIKRKEFLCPKCKEAIKTENKITYLQESNGKKVKCLSVFRYIGDVKNAIWRFKFRGHKHYSEFFAKVMAEGIQSNVDFSKVNFDYLCFVPIRKERKRNRGYNQAECLARDISLFTGIPCKDVIEKIKSNHIQHELDLIHRYENVKGVYAVKDKDAVNGKTIIICDDIITSGNTLRECAKMLFEGGAKDVYCTTIAYIPKLNVEDRNQ